MDGEQARNVAFAIIGEVADLLDRRGIGVPSTGRDGGRHESRIYGSEYTELQKAIEDILLGGHGGDENGDW